MAVARTARRLLLLLATWFELAAPEFGTISNTVYDCQYDLTQVQCITCQGIATGSSFLPSGRIPVFMAFTKSPSLQDLSEPAFVRFAAAGHLGSPAAMGPPFRADR